MKKTIRTTAVIVSAGIFILFIFVVFVNIHMISFSSKFIANNPGVPVQAVVVLGARVYPDGTPCAMLQDRLDAGIREYTDGSAGRILLTGDHGTIGYDEVNSMMAYTIGKGIPEEDVFLDHAGFSTFDSMTRAVRIFEIESAVISTQEFHLHRAVYIARKSGIDAWGVKADLRKYPKSEMLRYTVREWLARTKDFIYVNILKKEPVFLGEKIPITGDSNLSYD